MRTVFVFVLLFSQLLSVFSQTCSSTGLGTTYSAFNVISFGDYQPSGGCSIAGRLAAQGKVDVQSYSIAGSLNPRLTCTGTKVAPTSYAVMAGGKVKGNGGTVYGHISYQTNYQNTGGFTLSPSACTATQELPISFTDMFSFYDKLSTQLGALPATGRIVSQFGGLYFYGSMNTVREVFNIPSSFGPTFPQFRTFSNISSSATLIFNLFGTQVTLSNFDVSAIDAWMSRIVYNMPQATQYTQDGLHLKGLILAPYAQFASNNGGQITGQFVTGPYGGSGCIAANLGTFSGCIPDVSGPCAGKAAGATCDDGNSCTTNDVCLAAGGTCAGTAITCNSPGVCQTAGTCVSGVCVYPNATNGATCNDGNACTQTDTCQNGVCTGSNPVTCASRVCANPGVCNTATGQCTYTNLTNGATCNDGNACTQTDTCQNGVCTGSNPVQCTALGQCYTAGVCNTTTGVCSNPFATNGVSCNDGNGCTQTDTCQNGVCTGSNTKTCGNAGECTDAPYCNPTTGNCVVPNKANGTICTSVSNCFTSKTCQSGVCTGSAPVQCPPPGQCQMTGVCTDGNCSYQNKTNGATCDDGNPCTTNDVCTNGVCAGTSITCAAAGTCKKAGVCNINSGICEYANQDNGFSCEDGNPCTLQDTCQAGVCTSGSAKQCAAAGQCQFSGVCNTTTGNCDYANRANGLSCSDGNLCNINTCQNGACVLSSTVQCAAPGTCKAAGVCQPSTGACTYANLNGTSCNDGNACTQTDLCIAGVCTGFNSKVCTTDQICKAPGTCDPNTGVCSIVNAPNGQTCDDNDLCSYSSTCQSGVCSGSQWVTCAPPPSQCHNQGVCSAASGQCVYTLKADGSACDDGNACSASSSCQSGVCTGANWKVCTATDQCLDAGTCNPSNGVCSTPNKPAGSVCNDGNSCTLTDTCSAGVCVGNNSIVGCTNGGYPYVLLTNVTSPITQTQSTWIPLNFKGLRDLTMFQVRVTNFPTGGNQFYTFGYIEYPSGRNYTMPNKKDGLNTDETDYVAIKLNPPQNQNVGSIVLQLEVKYQVSGSISIGREIVTVPVTASLGDFSVASSVSPVGSLYAGQSAWFPISFTSLSRLLNFQVTFSATNGLKFDYPSNTGNYTSFYRDSLINVGETDFVAVRVTAPQTAVAGNMDAVMTVRWTGVSAAQTTVPVSFKIRAPGTKKDIQPFNLMDTDLTVPADTSMWVLLNMQSSSALDKVQVEANSANALVESAITRFTNVGADELIFAPALVTASESMELQVTIKSVVGDEEAQTQVWAPVTAQPSYLQFQSGTNLEIAPGATNTYSLGYSLPDAVIGNIQLNPLTVVSGLNIQMNPTTTTDGMASWFIFVDVAVDSSVQEQSYPITLEITYNTAQTGEVSEKESIFVTVKKDATAPPSGNSSKTNSVNVGAAVGGTIGGVALVALIAAAALIVKNKRNKINSFSEMQDEKTLEH